MPNDSNSSLRRSERQRKLTYDTLNQSCIFNQVSDYFIGSRAPHRLRSDSNHHEVDSPHDIEREGDRRSMCRHRREILSLNINPHDSDPEEEVLDIYSRVKRRKRRISSAVYETAPHVEESSNQSSLLGAVEANRRTNLTPKKEPVAEMSTDGESSEEQMMQRRYFLREQKSAPQRFNYSVEPLKKRMDVVKNNSDYEQRAFQSPAHKRIKHNFSSRRRRTFRRKLENAGSSSTSDTDGSDDEKQFERRLAKSLDRSRNRFLPLNMPPKSSNLNGISRQRNISTAIGADLDPMTIDTTIGFKDIGGLKHHLQTLKEMILFPLIYPEIFEKFKITPPRGVIFYGSPGTGKTLVARALANECFKGEKKVSFFMRKGADCLSKWVGESERQLRLLFDQAYTMRPSIIFFDEIDGLAPIRSSRQDQIHSSIVSTLLALMDGLDQRGEIIVIGATNRLDAIDPALRRPGRFDRELLFKLPDKEARSQILKIHTSDWNPPLQDDFIETLSSKLVGYCGADIKGLCTEAALIALRKKFPQIYASEKRLQVDSSVVAINVQDFETAIHHLVPSTKRGLNSVSRQLPEHLAPLLSQDLDRIVSKINDEFKNDKTNSIKDGKSAEFSTDGGQSYADILDIFKKKKAVFGQKMILCANGAEHGQTTYLAPAAFHVLDHLPVFSLSLPQIFSSNYRAAEEAVSEIMSTAAKFCPCVVYIPSIDVLMRVAPHSAWYTFISIIESWSHSLPILLFATANECYRSLDDEIKNVFDEESSVLIMQPNANCRRNFFAKLFNEQALKVEEVTQEKNYEALPEAPPCRPKQLTENENKKFRKLERRTLRELRIFLREILGRLIRDRRFAFFAKPVDPEQAPDYTQIVENPMYFSLMMSKIDQHKYDKVQQFLDDIDLITRNALEYNPDREEMGKVIRHRACSLRDVAYALIEEEYDSEFEQQCEEIDKFRQERELGESADLPPAFVYVAPVSSQNAANSNGSSATNANERKSLDNCLNLPNKKDPNRAAAIVKKYKATRRLNLQKTSNGDLSGLNSSRSDVSASNLEKEIFFDGEIDHQGESNLKNGHNKSSERNSVSAKPSVTFDRPKLNRLLDTAVSLTNDWPIRRIEKSYAKIVRSIDRHAASSDKNPLIEELESVLRSL